MRFTLKAGQKAIKTLTKGYTSHHEKYIAIKFKMEDRKISNNNKQTIEVLAKYFHSVCNRSTKIDWDFVNSTEPK